MLKNYYLRLTTAQTGKNTGGGQDSYADLIQNDSIYYQYPVYS